MGFLVPILLALLQIEASILGDGSLFSCLFHIFFISGNLIDWELPVVCDCSTSIFGLGKIRWNRTANNEFPPILTTKSCAHLPNNKIV